MDKNSPGVKANEERLSKIETDILRIAHAVQTMNAYQVRLPEVAEAMKAMLAPNQDVVRASESIAQVRSAKASLGTILAVSIEWDDAMHFLFMVRAVGGYVTTEGMSLEPDHPGLEALKEAMTVLGVDGSVGAFNPPTKPSRGGLKRRVLYEMPPPTAESEKTGK